MMDNMPQGALSVYPNLIPTPWQGHTLLVDCQAVMGKALRALE